GIAGGCRGRARGPRPGGPKAPRGRGPARMGIRPQRPGAQPTAADPASRALAPERSRVRGPSPHRTCLPGRRRQAARPAYACWRSVGLSRTSVASPATTINVSPIIALSVQCSVRFRSFHHPQRLPARIPLRPPPPPSFSGTAAGVRTSAAARVFNRGPPPPRARPHGATTSGRAGARARTAMQPDPRMPIATLAAALQLGQALHDQPLLALASLFGAGVLTSLTPCVYPMIPITAGLIASTAQARGREPSRLRVASLTLTYVSGLALLYALLGLFAGLSGQIFGTVSSSPWASFTIGCLLIVFGLAMVDVIPVNAPRRLAAWAGSLGGGSYPAVFLLGATSGLVAAPCGAPAFAAVLTWVSTT